MTSSGSPGSLGRRAAILLGLLVAASPARAQQRRVALRVSESLLTGSELQRLAGFGKRAGLQVDLASDRTPVPADWEAVFVETLPASESARRLLSGFPIHVVEKGFVFDGRSYRREEDAVSLTDPARGEIVVLGNSGRAAIRLAARRAFWGEEEPADYEVVSGELIKRGRFARGVLPLAIDRASDRDEIAAQDEFVRSQTREVRSGVTWRFRESERAGIARWEPPLQRFLGGKKAGPLSVRLYPDAARKARVTGSSRPADVSREGNEIVLDVDLSAPAEPDCVTPVLASAALASQDPRLLERPMLLAALGARAAGKWWGREVASFAAFTRAARVEPTVEQVAGSDPEISPILAVGAAAAWLDAGARSDGEGAVRRALAGTDAQCRRALALWKERAGNLPVVAPGRRPLPPGFLRGVSYAMSNSIAGGYTSARSRETLSRLLPLSVNAISVMPFAFAPDGRRPELSFVHHSPQGESDESTVRAVADARALGMTAMVKPQIWLQSGFIGGLAMQNEDDWGRWFEAYRRFAVHHAVVAQASGASIFCVGTELIGTESRRREWLETIAAVRLATGAALTYAANWAAGAARVPFWDAVDAVGVDFYDPLSTKPDASDAQIEAGVQAAVSPLADLARRTGKPVLFTEAGFPPAQAAWMSPHDENTGRPLAPGDAARSITAVFRALETAAWWRGVYWWKVFSDGHEARPGERGFNLLGSPSQKSVADGFARRAATKRAAS